MTRSVRATGSSGRALAGVGVLVLLALCNAGHAQSGYGDSQWDGAYYYSDNRPPVPFKMQMQQNGGKVSGRISEPATFGDGSSPNLYANLSGVVTGTSISFVKTYDGTGGQTHSVQYDGGISLDGLSVTGNWRVGNVAGTFNASVTELSCSLCEDALVRNVRLRAGDSRNLQAYVEQVFGYYRNCKARAVDQCGSGDRRLAAFQSCNGFAAEPAYQSCISAALGP